MAASLVRIVVLRFGPKTGVLEEVVAKPEINRGLEPIFGIISGLPVIRPEHRFGLHFGQMIPLPKPRGFWDYGFFALMLTGLLVLLFWVEASDGVGWADAALAFAAAVLCVLIIALSRRNEQAAWIVRSSWQVNLLVAFGSFLLMFGALYADAYILHRGDITATRIRHDMILAIALPIATLFPLRRRNTAPR